MRSPFSSESALAHTLGLRINISDKQGERWKNRWHLLFSALVAIATAIYALSIAAEPRFADVTTCAGINHKGPTFGASWGDFNGDGLPDLWVGNHYTMPSLYLNQGNGSLVDIATSVWPGPVRDTHGVAWADFDNDGDQDFIEGVGGTKGNHLFVNDNGLLFDQASLLGVDTPGARSRTPLWLDWDRDGWLDLVLTQQLGNGQFPFVMRNNGTSFEDATETVGVTLIGSNFAQLADLTEDGELDLIVPTNRFPGPVYDITNVPFQEVSASLNIPPHAGGAWPGGAPMDLLIADFNGDQRNDIFVARQGANYELAIRNDQRIDFKLTAIGDEKAVSFQATAPITISVFPYWGANPQTLVTIGESMQSPNSFSFSLDPNDPTIQGIPVHQPGIDEGVFIGFDSVTQSWHVAYSSPVPQVMNFIVEASSPITDIQTIGFEALPPAAWPSYFVRTDTGFEERRSESGLAFGMPCNSGVAGDFDNDMDLDIYLACARSVSNSPNILLENLGDGAFSLVPHAGGAEGTSEGLSETVVAADYDQDGFLDLFVTNGNGGAPFNRGPHQLFRNLGTDNHWIEIDLVGTISNPDAIGATVALTAAGITQQRVSDGGMHRRAQNYKRLHFGLGKNSIVDQVEIRWPSGIVEKLDNIPADQIILAVELEGEVE